MKTFPLPRILAVAGIFLALFALGTANVAHAAGIRPGTDPSPVANRLSLSPAKQLKSVAAGQTYIYYYKVYNAGADAVKVQLAAASDANWEVSLSANEALVPAQGAFLFKVLVRVPAATTVDQSTVKIGVFGPGSEATGYLILRQGPSSTP